ncbi:tryparedoxin [Trypanosoma grayi]|uniref:tryparedoxin n=1 Tax=Trypanosoma grayi TaxID=71804 RepID=UPI0004F44F18|nr:tryparedoxin [Trypanosoma grayi]KEG14701.1 tryparedoxin [Trypanosoma grayi]
MISQIFETTALDLLRQDGTTVAAATALQGKKYVLLLFSASWCPPCRIFTPQLATFHESFHRSHNFEVVFFSQDRDESSMLAYFFNPKYSRSAFRGGEGSHGNWLAVPYAQAKTVGAALMRRHKILGIPTVLVFDLESGELVTGNARNLVVQHLHTAEGFPWAGSAEAETQSSAWQHLVAMLVFVVLYYLWR